MKQKYTDLLSSAGISPNTLYSVFDHNSIERGITYYEQRKVTGLVAESRADGNDTIRAKVQGNRPYSTSVTYNPHNPKWITSVCTCPVGSACKHGVAVLFARLDQLDLLQSTIERTPRLPAFLAAMMPTAATAPISAIDSWLKSLRIASNAPLLPEMPSTEKPKADLLYLLTLGASKKKALELELCKSIHLKKGGYGKPSPVRLEVLANPQRTKGFGYEAADLMIAQLLATPELRFGSYSTSGTLRGAIGASVLEYALETGRAFCPSAQGWQGTESPLQHGEARELNFQWKKVGGVYHVEAEVFPNISDHFWLDGKPHYLDRLRAQCGLLQHPELSQQQVEAFLDAPPIPAAQVDAVSERLLEVLPDADIPTPSAKTRQPIADVHAKPSFDLLLRKAELGEERTTHLASLRFNYAGHLLQPAEPTVTSMVKTDGKRYRIHRDIGAETQALETLHGYGFGPPPENLPTLKPLDLLLQAQNRALAALRWNDFLEYGVEALEQQGWRVTREDNFVLQFDTVETLEAAWEETAASSEWFEISLGFEIDGQRVNLLPMLVEMLAQMDSPQALRELLQRQEHFFVPLSESRWAKLESSRLAGIMDTLVELYDHQPLNADGNLLLSKYQGVNLAAILNDPQMRWKGAEELLALTQKLRDFTGITAVQPPAGLQAELRHYQLEGLSWLQFLREFQFSGTLADDMGLGKTLQALANLQIEQEAGRTNLPSLVVAPTSLMSNWRREAERFTPNLRILVLHGNQRAQHFGNLGEYEVIFTTYPLMLRDAEIYQKMQFHYLILDEAQAIKNATAKTTQIIYGLKAHHRLCLTGTPLENHLGELWSMFHFLMPGFLSTHEKFTRLFRNPVEKQGDMGRQQQLRSRIQPFMLRRTKQQVASELPPKTEIIRTVALEGAQRDLYETVRLAMDAKLREEISQKGFARSQIMILDALLKLRQVCCDPRLVKLEKAKSVKASAKLTLLMEMLVEMLEEGRKVLLFSQFTSMLALIETELKLHGILYSKLTGQTLKREEAIAAFQEGDAQVFLISLKAGGTGLNLTAADTVIHYDPWWNPAVEQQATDRAYRIGQDKPVFVYKLITEETVEEKILKLQERKQALADGMYSDKAQDEGARFSSDDLMELLKPLEK